jgi:hypothetical protein
MKIKLLVVALLATISTAGAQTSKPSWPQMKTFHSFMAASFHPAEEGNFEPLRAKADSLFITAQLWQASPVPSNYKPDETKAALVKLVTQCGEINKSVKANVPNADLKKMITDAHDTFHYITGECKKADE